MADKVENLSLYSVRVGERTIASQIEASSDEEAFAAAAERLGAPDGKREILSKEPVYEKSIGLDCSEDSSGSAVFEIRVRGVSADKVDAVAKALRAFIGGPGMLKEDLRKIGSAEPFRRAVDGVMAFA